MSNDNLRAAITAALKRRDPNADLDVSPTCTPLGAWVSLAGGVIRGPDGAVIDVVARAGDDAKALRGVAFAIGLRDDGSDPAEEVERLRAHNASLDNAARDALDELATARAERDAAIAEARRLRDERRSIREGIVYVGASCDREITIDGVALRASHLSPTRFDVERLTRERDEAIALERERCAGLVRELTAAPPGSRRTAASRNLAERVAACVRAIEVDDETATCARSLVREARERAKAAEADLARMRAELDATREALRAHLFCDECEELATRCHAESASFGCDAHGVGDGWADATHAAAVRAAGGVR